MARRKPRQPSGDWLFPLLSDGDDTAPQSSLLDVVDNVLDKGAVLNGDLVLGVANVDLIYAKLSVLLAAIDKIASQAEGPRRPGRRRHHASTARTAKTTAKSVKTTKKRAPRRREGKKRDSAS